MIDLEWVRRLIEIVEEAEIDSIEIRRLTTRIRIAKSPPVQWAAAPPAGLDGGAAAGPAALAAAAQGSAAAAGGPAGGAAPAGETPAAAAAEAGAGAELHEVVSPMVGTFYRAPAPDAPAYVEVGDRIRKGQTLCILEAMKLMNELEADIAGTIREICVDNAEPVEYGQILFRVELDAGA